MKKRPRCAAAGGAGVGGYFLTAVRVARFFIKYYRQAKRLPLRDVKVTENYSSAEREERLEAVRELIDSGQSEYALQRILEEYGDVLDDSEVQDAKALLAEIEKENHTEDEK